MKTGKKTLKQPGRLPEVGIVMGSDSDLKIMEEAASVLKQFGISYEMTVASAHRSPKRAIKFATSAHKRGIKVIIAGAGHAAHLAGMHLAAGDRRSHRFLMPSGVRCTPINRSNAAGGSCRHGINRKAGCKKCGYPCCTDTGTYKPKPYKNAGNV